MDKSEWARAACLFSTRYFFSQSTSSCTAAANVYHTGVFIAMGGMPSKSQRRGYFCSNPLFVCQINFHSGPESGRASKRKGGSCDCALKKNAAHRLIRLLQSQGQKIIWPGVMAWWIMPLFRIEICSAPLAEKRNPETRASSHCTAWLPDWHVIKIKRHIFIYAWRSTHCCRPSALVHSNQAKRQNA